MNRQSSNCFLRIPAARCHQCINICNLIVMVDSLISDLNLYSVSPAHCKQTYRSQQGPIISTLHCFTAFQNSISHFTSFLQFHCKVQFSAWPSLITHWKYRMEVKNGIELQGGSEQWNRMRWNGIGWPLWASVLDSYH